VSGRKRDAYHDDTYTGTTAVNTGGTLIVSGSISATSATTVATGGNLEVMGLLPDGAAAVSVSFPVLARSMERA